MSINGSHLIAFACLIAAGLLGIAVLPVASRWDIGERGMSLFSERGTGAVARA